VIGFDSNVFIYILENNPDFFTAASRALKQTIDSHKTICVSVLAITEILSGTNNKVALDILRAPGIVVHDLTKHIAAAGGALRFASPSLKTPDAIHIATALTCGASSFVTNDKKLLKLNVGIEIVPLGNFGR
jgi:predicted nucleic acid-binding protein